MARARTPAWRRRLEGSDLRTPPPFEVVLPPGQPFVPEHLSDDAQFAAEHIIETFRGVQCLSSADTYILSTFAVAWSIHKRAAQEISSPKFRPIVNGKPNPWFKVLNEQAKIIADCGARLYLSPKDRMFNAAPGARPLSNFDGLICPMEDDDDVSKSN